jgi:tRNA U34 5-methylaminomethyl-2-thiouridine-forming methyltransferase MnmC
MSSDSTEAYRLVQVASGAHSVHSIAHKETFHPVIGPVAEAEALYVRQGQLAERLGAGAGDFVIWDVGLGAAANALTVLRAACQTHRTIRLISFDHSLSPLQFGFEHRRELGYFDGFEVPVAELIQRQKTTLAVGAQGQWELHLADFPGLLMQPEAQLLAKPDLIMFDAFSPATNPAMWTLPLFSSLFNLLDPARPCLLPTYSRSTMLRVTLLLAGFFVGVGHATGEKDETTVAANHLDLLSEPLGTEWLKRVRRSTSAEPLHGPSYQQKPLSSDSLNRLLAHPQFP